MISSRGGRNWLFKSRWGPGPHVSPALMAGTDKEDVDDPEDCLRKSRNSVRSCCAAASSCATLCVEVCNDASTENEDTVREPNCAETSWERELCKSVCTATSMDEGHTLRKIVCTATSRDNEGPGWSDVWVEES